MHTCTICNEAQSWNPLTDDICDACHKNMTPRIIKTEPTTPDGQISFLIDFGIIDGEPMQLWFDAYKDEDGEVAGDWNRYIFHTNNEQDMKEKAFQEAHNDEVGAYNYATALELAETLF